MQHDIRYFDRRSLLSRVIIRAAASNRVVNYASNLLLLEYSLLSIYGCKFPVAVFWQSINCCYLWKPGALRFHLQLASLEIDLNIVHACSRA